MVIFSNKASKESLLPHKIVKIGYRSSLCAPRTFCGLKISFTTGIKSTVGVPFEMIRKEKINF